MKCQYCSNRIPASVYACPVCGNDTTISKQAVFERTMLVFSFALMSAFVLCLVWLSLQ